MCIEFSIHHYLRDEIKDYFVTCIIHCSCQITCYRRIFRFHDNLLVQLGSLGYPDGCREQTRIMAAKTWKEFKICDKPVRCSTEAWYGLAIAIGYTFSMIHLYRKMIKKMMMAWMPTFSRYFDGGKVKYLTYNSMYGFKCPRKLRIERLLKSIVNERENFSKFKFHSICGSNIREFMIESKISQHPKYYNRLKWWITLLNKSNNVHSTFIRKKIPPISYASYQCSH